MSAARIEETREQFGERAAALYERVVKPKLKPEDDGKFVAVDANTGEFEVDVDDYAVVETLLHRLPDAVVWLERAGHSTAYEHFGVRSFAG
jgi:hypothetical protein